MLDKIVNPTSTTQTVAEQKIKKGKNDYGFQTGTYRYRPSITAV